MKDIILTIKVSDENGLEIDANVNKEMTLNLLAKAIGVMTDEMLLEHIKDKEEE